MSRHVVNRQTNNMPKKRPMQPHDFYTIGSLHHSPVCQPQSIQLIYELT